MNPLVSIILPVFNSEHFIGDCIESIFGQSYKNIELIVINDGSTDKTIDQLLKYKNKNLKIINQKNIGIAASINKGIMNSSGEYIARIDADDICYPQRISKQVNYLEVNKNIAALGTYADLIDESGNLVGEVCRKNENNGDFLFSMLERRTIILHPSVMIRKSVLKKVNYYDEYVKIDDKKFYNIDNPYPQDYLLWMKMIEAGYSLTVLREKLIKYRLHSKQKTKNKSKLQPYNHILNNKRKTSIEHFFKFRSDNSTEVLLKFFNYDSNVICKDNYKVLINNYKNFEKVKSLTTLLEENGLISFKKQYLYHIAKLCLIGIKKEIDLKTIIFYMNFCLANSIISKEFFSKMIKLYLKIIKEYIGLNYFSKTVNLP